MGKSSRGSSRAAEIQAEASIQAAELAATGTTDAAGLTAEATTEAASMIAAAQREAVEEQKRQYNATVQRMSPYVELGEEFIDDVRQGSIVSGLDERIRSILDTDVFGALNQERQQLATQNMAAAGLTRSGRAAEAAADIGSSLAMQIEGQLFGRQAGNVQIGQAAAGNLAASGQNYANAVSGILMNGAGQQGQILTQGAAQQGAYHMQGAQFGANGIMNAANAQANGLIAQQQQRNTFGQNLLGAGLTALSFSDERLKENLEPIGKVKNLTLYEWDWRDDVKELIDTEMATGFKAQEVKEKYPECVIDYHGVLAIDYPHLYEKLGVAA